MRVHVLETCILTGLPCFECLRVEVSRSAGVVAPAKAVGRVIRLKGE
jgi:hypothetical protein